MPGSEACIVGPVFLPLSRVFSDQPTPKAAVIFRLTGPVFLVSRGVLGIALDVSGPAASRSRMAASATEGESKAATTISVMTSPCAWFRQNAGDYKRA